ncbi:winged helix-turn-helix transcriptional regulator, partial [Pseudomonas syringae]|uniref:winged helix-turn-helix transcriptional regulator n=1 Tax=Pseudomonas syringae TaxID=317 RepID=UPI003907EA95
TNMSVRNAAGGGYMSLSDTEFSDGPHDEESCRALGEILDRIGDKWTVMVVGILSCGPMRFNTCNEPPPGSRTEC